MTPPVPALRIGMLAPGYPSGARGDYRGIFVQEMARHLEARGHRVCIVTSRLLAGDVPLVKPNPSEEVHRFGFWSEGRPVVEYRRVPPLRMATYLLSAARAAARDFRAFRCDLVHSHFLVPMGPVGAWTSRRMGVPHILTVHGSDSRMVVGRAMLRPLGRWTLRRADALTATALHVRRDLETLGADAARVELMPMGIGEGFLAEPPPFDTSAPPALLSTRTLREDPYQISTLIRAMKALHDRFPGLRCTIAGDGPDRARYEALARELGVEGAIDFTGWSSPEQLAQMLRSHPIYVSTSRADGASVSLFEALASGSYPVLSDIDANREWIRDGQNGSLFAPGDTESLAAQVMKAWAAPEARQAAVAANRRTALERFAWPGIAQRLELIYLNLLNKTAGDS